MHTSFFGVEIPMWILLDTRMWYKSSVGARANVPQLVVPILRVSLHFSSNLVMYFGHLLEPGVYVCSLRAHTIMQLYSTSVQFSPTLKVAFFSIRKQQYSNNQFILLRNQEFISRIWQLDDGVLPNSQDLMEAKAGVSR